MWQRLISIKGEDTSLWQRLTKNFSISLGGSVATICIRLLQTALLSKSLAISDYGKVLIVIHLFSFLENFLGVRVNDIIYRFYPQFRQHQDTSALGGLLFLCLALSLVVGFAIAGGIFILSPWIAQHFYADADLALPFRIYASTALIAAFSGFYTSILRLHDDFAAIVIPQTLGAAMMLAVLGIYLYSTDNYRLEFVVTACALGVFIQTVLPFVKAMGVVRPYLFSISPMTLFRALQPYRRELVSTLFQTNLIGYLKLASDSGGLFLLGILASPQQVALYGIAQQLTKPLLILQNNIQTAITPEVTSLLAKGKVEQLYRLVKGFVSLALIIGGIAVIFALLLSQSVILWITQPQYLEALPTFSVLIIAVYLTCISLIFYPLAVSLDQLQKRNLVVAMKLLYLGVAVSIGLNAVRLSFVQLIGALSTRLLVDIPLLIRLRKMTKISHN
ncbi:MAG: lipopolysaccharide biosynthesis protein [Coleofasciculus sp. B1-GNL1-01]|uniref:lipopolysaccharide biosynthesis protein n=1 Tax=Coleofasciculus sp. B1-GNL1-01 TaxID=3068484 RepID=UPI0032FB75E5